VAVKLTRSIDATPSRLPADPSNNKINIIYRYGSDDISGLRWVSISRLRTGVSNAMKMWLFNYEADSTSLFSSKPSSRSLNNEVFKQVRQCTYKRNIEKRSSNDILPLKSRSISCSDCLFLAFVIQQASAHVPYYIATCGLSGCVIFFHIISQRGLF
jgi:hypothetical protein